MSNNLLHPIEVVAGRIDHFNKMLLDRVRGGASHLWSRTEKMRPWLPPILFSLLIVYLFMGSAIFWALEHHNHEISSKRWALGMGVKRKNCARTISSRIFNDTRNLLIIIDREQTERVQQLLFDSLREYENKLDLRVPDKNGWTFMSSLNYAYGLLLTLGHGAKIPGTFKGQIFALLYCVIGIPLFYATIAVSAFTLLKPFLNSTTRKHSQRLLVLYLVLALYIVWSLLMALVLYNWISDSFWNCAFTAFLAGMTVQIPLYSSLTQGGLLALLGASTVSITILIMAAILLSSVYCPCDGSPTKEPLLHPHQPSTSEPQKFTIIVDEAGDSKLAEQH